MSDTPLEIIERELQNIVRMAKRQRATYKFMLLFLFGLLVLNGITFGCYLIEHNPLAASIQVVLFLINFWNFSNTWKEI